MRSARLWTLLTAILAMVAAGCAAIPDESQPEAVPREGSGQSAPETPEPDSDLDPLSLVREFVRASAQPSSDHAASRVYLTPEAREGWKPDRGLKVIKDEFGTVYPPAGEQSDSTEDRPSEDADEQPSSTADVPREEDEDESPGEDGSREEDPEEDNGEPRDENDPEDDSHGDGKRSVVVQGTQLGRLGSDHAFISSEDEVEKSVQVARQPDGQWRISEPPDTLMITEEDFSEAYVQVPVYFVAPDSEALVPDLRYVVGRPRSGLPVRVMDVLLSGPSDALTGAVRSMLDDDVTLESNVTDNDDGAVVVPLTGVGEQSEKDRELLAAQVVSSLQKVTTDRIQLLNDGRALVPGQIQWRSSDLPAYEALTSPSSDLPGMMVVNGHLHSLGTGEFVSEPTGAGNTDVESAAQSIGGQQLAVIEEEDDDEVQLRVGEFDADSGTEEEVVDMSADTMTRPSWRPPVEANGLSEEVWTVVDGDRVMRVKPNPDDQWTPQRVNASDLTEFGSISALRLSRDGSRVAAVVDDKLVLAAVVREPDGSSVTLHSPTVIRRNKLDDVIDVDWSKQDELVVATSSDSSPVVRVSVDGLQVDSFNSSNLTPPVRAITAAPGRPITAADDSGLWTASDVGAVWRPHEYTRWDAEAFYPG